MGRKAIGIDIGGTKIAMGVVDQHGDIHDKISIPTLPHLGFDDAVERMNQTIASFCSSHTIGGIGIGCPGPLDLVEGTVLNGYTLPSWKGSRIVDAFATKWKIPAILEHDVNAALYGNARALASPKDNIAMLSFGTGVGVALVLDGDIYHRSAHGLQELGHMVISGEDTTCYCHQKGCLEQMASGTAFHQRLDAMGLTFEQFVERLNMDDEAAMELASLTVDSMDRALWNLALFYDVECFILGGGFMDGFYAVFQRFHNHELFNSGLLNVKPTIIPSPLSNEAGMVGAARMVLEGK